MDTGDIIAILIALTGPVIAFVMGMRRAPHEERKLDAETDNIYTQVGQLAMAQNAALLRRLSTQEIKLERETDDNRQLLIGVAMLIAQLIRHGEQPVWTPEAIVRARKAARVMNGKTNGTEAEAK